ncbi:TetR family transcriptional regulator [Streptomyces sp. NPDC102467]|uniref:TetR family transcriptional regulator n=1 Tax=Streptomyces sp. NPDC102467 TaxID=3366179 RepID=UPI00380D6A2D
MTRRRIERTALRLFVERGYDRTSLQDIADEAGLTKAALYYYFRTREALAEGVLAELTECLEELAAWAGARSPGEAAAREALHRCDALLAAAAPQLRLVRENRAAVRQSTVTGALELCRARLSALMMPATASPADRMRCRIALSLLLDHEAREVPDGGTAAEPGHSALLEVALDPVTRAHQGAPAPASAALPQP